MDSGSSSLGAIDPSDGGQTTRYSLSFEGGPLSGLGSPQWAVDAFVIGYNLDLWSNFTFSSTMPRTATSFIKPIDALSTACAPPHLGRHARGAESVTGQGCRCATTASTSL